MKRPFLDVLRCGPPVSPSLHKSSKNELQPHSPQPGRFFGLPLGPRSSTQIHPTYSHDPFVHSEYLSFRLEVIPEWFVATLYLRSCPANRCYILFRTHDLSIVGVCTQQPSSKPRCAADFRPPRKKSHWVVHVLGEIRFSKRI